jgi:putative DNA primase/helicase
VSIGSGGGDICAKDTNVLRRRWLPLDLDPVRPSGISSTDSEKTAAYDTAMAVRDFLRAEGWPESLFGDSGNGFHRMFRVDLPADDGGVIERVLWGLAERFDNEHVKIDHSVHNPARIWKLPGTWARKGDHTAERPHRRAQLLEVPARDGVAIAPDVVPLELLDAVAKKTTQATVVSRPTTPQRAAGRQDDHDGRHRLMVERWLTDNGRGFRIKPNPEGKGRTVFVLDACPFDPSHKDPDSCIMQDSAGKLSAKCLHDSCAGRGWQDFKQAIGKPSKDHFDPPFPERRPGRARHEGNGKPTPTATATTASPDDYHLTDLGNAQRLVQDHGEHLYYCHPWRKWIAWDEQRWRIDDSGEAKRRAKATIKKLYDEATEALAELKKTAGRDAKLDKKALEELDNLILHAIKSEDARALARMLDLAQSEPCIPVSPGEFDRQPMLLNCDNGTVDLRTGELQPHNPDDMITKLCPTRYDPEAQCPRWLQAIDRIFDGDNALVEYLQRSLGYGLTGDVREDVLAIWWGVGANGKTTIINATLETLGTDFAGTVPPELLLDTAGQQHPTIMASLHGKRLLFAVETPQGRRLNEERLKRLTGRDPIDARRCREDWWSFLPTHKLVLVTNHKPVVRGTDHGMWRRLRLVPFTVTFLNPTAPENVGKVIPEDRCADPGLAEALSREREGILAWLVRGCLDWQQYGLTTPAAVQGATAEYRSAEDVVGAFMTECCATGGADYRVQAGDLYAGYVSWTEASGERPMSKKQFGDTLTERGIERFNSHGWWYRGIALQPEILEQLQRQRKVAKGFRSDDV